MAETNEILTAIRRITRAIDIHSRRLVKETGLTSPQLVVLQALKREDNLSTSQLAGRISLSQPTVTSILDRLSTAGFIERVKDSRDRRVVHIHLTPQGTMAADKAPELLQAGFVRAYSQLPSWERHMLIASLQRVAELMDVEDLDASPILESREIDHQDKPRD